MALRTLPLAQVQGIFKNVAKFIYIHQLAAGTVADPTQSHGNKYRGSLIAAVDQSISGNSGEFAFYSHVAVPFATYDHRNNFNGDFAFDVYHPGGGTAQQPGPI